MQELTRRGFLGWAATGAAGLLVPTIVRPAPKVFDMGRFPLTRPAFFLPDLPGPIYELNGRLVRPLRAPLWTDRGLEIIFAADRSHRGPSAVVARDGHGGPIIFESKNQNGMNVGDRFTVTLSL